MKSICFILLLFSALSLSAQEGIDERLNLRFSEEQLTKMDESRIAYWNYYLDHAFVIMDIPAEKALDISEMDVINLSSSDFNGFSMALDSYHKEGAYLRFKSETKMVMIKPMNQIIAEFNALNQEEK